jgi:nucleoside-diphosphate-sugar epimerase
MKNKKILILGGAGYIMSHATDYLYNRCHEITIYDNLMFEDRYMKRNVDFIYGDIRDYDKLEMIIDDFDVVVLGAAIVGDPACQQNQQLAYEVNVQAVEWIAKRFKGYLVFPSSCSVYGMSNNVLNEESATNPLSWYASNKLEAEQIIEKYHNNYCIFRLGTVYGLPDNFSRMRLDLVVNVLSMKAARGEKLTVFGGEQWRPLIHVEDIAIAIAEVIEHEVNGIYNLSAKNYKISELAQIIQKQVPNTKVEYNDVPFQDTRNYQVDNSKFLNLNIWHPRFSIENEVRKIVDVIKQNRIKDVKNPLYSNADYMRLKNER